MSNESLDPESVDVLFGSGVAPDTADALGKALEREKRFTFGELRQCLLPFGEVLGERDAQDEQGEVGAVGLAHVHSGEHAIRLFMGAGGSQETRETAETYWDRYEAFQTNTFRCLLNILMLAGKRIRFYLEQPTAGFLQDIDCQQAIVSFDQQLQRGDTEAERQLRRNLFSGKRDPINATLLVRDGSLRLAAHCIANGHPSLVHSARPAGVSPIMPGLRQCLDDLARRRDQVTDGELTDYSRTYVSTMDDNMRIRHEYVAQSVASKGDHVPVIVFGYSHFRTQPPFLPHSRRRCASPIENFLPDRAMAVVMPAGCKELADMGTEADPGTMSPYQLRALLQTIASQSSPSV